MPRPRPIGRKLGLRSSDNLGLPSQPLPEASPSKRQRIEEPSTSTTELDMLDFDTGFDSDNNVEASVYGDNFVCLFLSNTYLLKAQLR